MSNLRFKSVMRLDTIQRHFRLFRVMWERGEVGFGKGYSVKLAIGLRAKLFGFCRDAKTDFILTVCGVRVHYSRSYGGIFA